MTKNDFLAEFLPHTNKNGFVNQGGGWTQNDILFHAFYIDLLDYYGWLDDEEIEAQKKIVSPLLQKPRSLDAKC